MWGQACAYAKLVIVIYFVLPALAIWLTWIAEKGGTHGHEKN